MFPDITWKKQICAPGQVRISDPRLPHGSTGPATKTRRTVLPWYVLVNDDMSTMEVPEMGTYAEIAMAHQALTAAPKSPSGHANKYGGIHWAFPGTTNPVFTSNISKAIHCQVRWDSPKVLDELTTYFTNQGRPTSKEAIDSFIDRTRKATVKMVKEHWLYCKAFEQKAFAADKGYGNAKLPDRSFFSTGGKHPQKVGEWWKHDGQIEHRSTLDALLEELGDNPDEVALRSRATSAAQGRSSLPIRQGSTESHTVRGSETPSLQSPLPSISESPAQQAAERRSKRIAGQQK
jgi:hypothetical protein